MKMFNPFSKHYFLLLMSLFFLIVVNGFSQQTILNQTVNGVLIEMSGPQNLQTCENSSIHVSMANNNLAIVDNFDLEFIDNTKLDILYNDLSNSNVIKDILNNKLTVSTLQVGEVFEFDIPVRANCSNFNDVTNTTVTGSLTIRPASVATSDFVFSFTIKSGFLEYISSDDLTTDNIFYQGHKGNSFVRRYNMKNTSANLYTGVLYMEEDIPNDIIINNLEVRINGVILNTPIISPFVDPLTKKMIYTFALNNVPSDGVIEIFESVSIIGCPISSGAVKLKHGCANDVCKELVGVSTPFQLELARGPEMPQLVMEELNPIDYNNCLSNNNNLTRTFRITNKGNAIAGNIVVPFYSSLVSDNMNLMLIDNTSFIYTKSNTSIAINLLSEELYTIDYIENQLLGNNLKVKYINCFSPLTEIIKNKVFKIDALEPGQYVDFQYSPKLCCVEKGLTTNIIGDDGFSNISYDDECTIGKSLSGATTNDFGYTNPGMNQFALSLVNNMFGCKDCGGNPGCFGNPSGNCLDATLNKGPNLNTDFTEEIIIKSTGIKILNLPMDLNNFRIAIDVAADGRLMLAPQSYAGASALPGNVRLKDSKGVVYTPEYQTALTGSVITDLFGTTDFPVVHDNYMGARAYFKFNINDIFTAQEIANFNSNGYRSINYDKLNGFLKTLEILFEVSGKCDRSPINNGPSNYFERMYLQPNTSCANCILPIGELNKIIIVNCPGCLFPGMVTSKYEVERVTVGLNDGDNNGLPDILGTITSGTTVNNNANLHMVTDNDIFRTTTGSSFWGGSLLTYGSGSNYGSLENYAGFDHRFLNNMCRLDVFSSHKDIFSMIIDQNNPVKIDYFRNGTTLFTINFTSNINNIYTTDNNGNFLLQFPVDLIRTKIGDQTFNYEAADGFDITCNYKVTGAFDLGIGIYYDNVEINNRCFFSGNNNPAIVVLKDVNNYNESDPSSPYGISGSASNPAILNPNMNYICEGFGSGLIIADIKESFAYGIGSVIPNSETNCIKYTGAAYGVMNDVTDGSRTNILFDLFPFEVRSFSKTKNFRFIVPRGHIIESVTLYSESSYRKAYEYDYTKVRLYKTLNASNYILIQAGYIDPLYGLMGDIYEVNYDYDNNLKYFNNNYTSPCPWCYETYLSSNENFSDFNEFVEQGLLFSFKPICSSPDLPNNIQFSDNANRRDYTVWYDKGLPIDGPKAYVVKFDNTINSFSSNSFANICMTDNCRMWFSKPSSQIDLVKLQPNIFINKKKQKIQFKLNLNYTAEKIFVYFTSDNSQFQFDNLKVNNIVVNKSSTTNIFELGYLGGENLLEIETSYFCNGNNNNSATFTIHYGYDCSEYPILNTTTNILSATPCKLKEDIIGVTLSPSDIEISYNVISGAVPCDELIHSLKINPLGSGNIYFDQGPGNSPVDISITLPSSKLTYLAGSAMLTAHNLNGTIMLDGLGNPQQYNLPDNLLTTNGLVFSWNLSGYSALDGIDINSNTGYYTLDFKTDPTCDFTGGQVSSSVNLLSYCNDNINKQLSPSYNIVFTENCSPINLNLTGPSKLCIPNTAGLSYNITGPTSSLGIYNLSWEINGIVIPSLSESLYITTFPYSSIKNFNLNNFSGNTSIKLILLSPDGCIISNTLLIQVNPKPIITLSLPTEYCLGNPPIQLSGTPTGGVFSGTGVTANAGLPVTYQFSTTTSGSYVITYSYTDPVTTCSNTEMATIVASPCCKYILDDVEVRCGQNEKKCIAIKAVRAVNDGIIGMDFTLNYNSAVMRPTGKYTIGSVVLNSNITNVNSTMADYSYTDNKNIPTNPTSSRKLLHGSIFYTGVAPASADFFGTGDVICVEFEMLSTATVGAVYHIYGGDMVGNTFGQGLIDEEYKLKTVRACMDDNGDGIVKIIKDNFLNGKIIYHDQDNTDSWLKYDPLDPAKFLITQIRTASVTAVPYACSPSTSVVTTTDLNGTFSLDMTGLNGLKISRDIVGDYQTDPTCTNPGPVINGSTNSILAAINGYDSYLMESITTFRNSNQVQFVSDRKVPGVGLLGAAPTLINRFNANTKFPTPYQMIAADVNMTNSVRANDITLVQQRAVARICEYPQVWNYTLGSEPNLYPANSADSRSLDWRFTDKSSGGDFNKTASYPNAAAVGYWRDDVPDVNACISAPAASGNACKAYATTKTIHAILLGDLDGSWRGNTTAQKTLKVAVSDEVVLDYKNIQQISTSTYRVPVKFNANDTTVSVDFALDYDETKLKVMNVGKLAAAENVEARVMFNDHNNQELLFTSYTMADFGYSNTLYYIDFVSMYGDMKPNYLGQGEGYLNGQRVDLRLEGATPTGTLDQLGVNGYGFEIIPNPNNGIGNILYNLRGEDNARIVVYNAVGQIVLEYNSISGTGALELSSAGLASGMYQVILFKGESDRLAKKMVIQK